MNIIQNLKNQYHLRRSARILNKLYLRGTLGPLEDAFGKIILVGYYDLGIDNKPDLVKKFRELYNFHRQAGHQNCAEDMIVTKMSSNPKRMDRVSDLCYKSIIPLAEGRISFRKLRHR